MKGTNYDDLVAQFEHSIGIKSRDVGNPAILPAIGAAKEPKRV
ncbi:hypothetical protein [Bifidobacterium sp. ESL0704]|nr:hypothetical protein [Bifidobacterium sp. ESL0704]WEV53567.1 hypothetical protein OZX64_03635 [Bifidobacterium sp. ESL0704]